MVEQVIRGSVVLGNNQDSSVVAAAAPLDRSVLTFGVATTENRPACAVVRGHLNSLGSAVFERYEAGCTASTIDYQVVVFARGAFVQRGEGELQTSMRSVVVPVQPVDPEQSFVLLSTRQGGSVFSGNDLFMVELAATGDSITIAAADDGQSVRRYYAWQVVQLNGISMMHRSSSLMGASLDVLPAVANASVIGTYRVENLSLDPYDPPAEMFVGWTAVPAITAARHDTGVTLGLNTQVITWPAPVQATSMSVVLSAGVYSTNLPTTAEWCFLGSNPFTAEVRTMDPDSLLSVASASVTCDGAALSLARGAATYTTAFTVWMVDF